MFTRVTMLALMLMGSLTSVSALETYDFQALCMALGKGGPWAVNDGGDAGFTINDATMHFLGDYTDNGFSWNQRFAYEYVDGRGKFTMRNKNNKKDSNCGMFSWDYAHYFSILGLGEGDKVTITIPTGTVTFVSENVEGVTAGDAVTSNNTYTITADGRLDIQMSAATLIAKIVIEPYGVETIPEISLSKSTLALVPGATMKLVATVTPSSIATTWSSSDESVATVAEDGTVTAVAGGTAKIINSWRSTISDAIVEAECVVTVAPVDLTAYVKTTINFTTMGDVTLELSETAAGAIWNEANSKNNNVFFCTNEGLENIAVQAAVSSNKGWSIVDGQGLFLASGAGRCAAIGGIKKGQIVEFIYTGDGFYTKDDGTTDDGIEKVALNEGVGRAIYLALEDGMIGFELVKGNAVKQINIYTVLPDVAEIKSLLAQVVELAEMLNASELTDIIANAKALLNNEEATAMELFTALNTLKDQIRPIAEKYIQLALSFCNNFGYNDLIPYIESAVASIETGNIDQIKEAFMTLAVNGISPALDALNKLSGYAETMEADDLKNATQTAIADIQKLALTALMQQPIKAEDVAAVVADIKTIKDEFVPASAAFIAKIQAIDTTGKQKGEELKSALDNAVGAISENADIVTIGVAVKELVQAYRAFLDANKTTGINNMAVEKMQERVIYNLQGQRVMNDQKGLFIVNGKKVLVK